ncbi:MAG: hypothetical protein AAFR87_27115 [Bacteroidota bacterium]
MNSQPKHVLILGCGRSGTSIFGEFFDHLPMYQYLSEPNFDDLAKLDQNQPIAIKVPRRSKFHPPDKGLSISVKELYKLFPKNLQIYWQLRHPLDTIASLKVGISKNWGHHPRPYDWEEWMEEPLIKKCAYHWAYINRFGFEHIKEIAQIKRFEDMLFDPMAFALQICKETDVYPETANTEIKASKKRSACSRLILSGGRSRKVLA